MPKIPERMNKSMASPPCGSRIACTAPVEIPSLTAFSAAASLMQQIDANRGGPIMAYRLEGRLLEVCDCRVLCPCWIGEDPDNGTCDSAMAYHFDAGQIEGVDVT